jgi:AbrB family looped-hinge helix DNA binding protein
MKQIKAILNGWVTVSSKGQVALPATIRKELGIKTGDRLLVILRKNKEGVNLILSSEVDKIFSKFRT